MEESVISFLHRQDILVLNFDIEGRRLVGIRVLGLPVLILSLDGSVLGYCVLQFVAYPSSLGRFDEGSAQIDIDECTPIVHAL